VIRVRITAGLVIGRDDVRPELAHQLDQRQRALGRVDQAETTLRKRRRRIALRQAGVDEAQPCLLHTEDLPRLGHLGAADVGDVRDHLGPVHLRIEDAAALAPRTRRDQHRHALGHVSGRRRGTLARLVVGVRVHRHQTQLLGH
jgi:hypothetical protein